MSSPNNFDSLSDLATNALHLQGMLTEDASDILKTWEEITPVDWDRLRNLINKLQVECPNHEGVFMARVRWYELALDCYEKKVVEVGEAGDSLGDKKWVGAFWKQGGPDRELGLLADQYMLEPFLRRSYLKDEFPRLFQRLMSLYRRLLNAPRLDEEVRGRVAGLISSHEQMLLLGRH